MRTDQNGSDYLIKQDILSLLCMYTALLLEFFLPNLVPSPWPWAEILEIEIWGRFFHVIFGEAILDIIDDGTILILYP